MKVIDSDTKVAEMYDELRKERRRDAQHCMPVKQIPDLNWEKENLGKENTELNAKTENRTGPTLRSSKRKQTVNEIKERVEAASNNDKEKTCTDFLAVAGTVIAAGVYTAASQFINSLIFNYRHSQSPLHGSNLEKHHTHQMNILKQINSLDFFPGRPLR